MILRRSLRVAVGLALTALAVHAQETPAGWVRGGSRPDDYAIGVTEKGCRGEGRCGFVRSAREDAEGFGALMQSFDAEPHVGTRLRLSASIRTEAVERWAGLWMRVDGEKGALAFDNMEHRPLRGTLDWRVVEVVLDVPEGAVAIWFGCLLVGDGGIWVDDFGFETVSVDVPTTDMMKSPAPTNLGFDQR